MSVTFNELVDDTLWLSREPQGSDVGTMSIGQTTDEVGDVTTRETRDFLISHWQEFVRMLYTPSQFNCLEFRTEGKTTVDISDGANYPGRITLSALVSQVSPNPPVFIWRPTSVSYNSFPLTLLGQQYRSFYCANPGERGSPTFYVPLGGPVVDFVDINPVPPNTGLAGTGSVVVSGYAVPPLPTDPTVAFTLPSLSDADIRYLFTRYGIFQLASRNNEREDLVGVGNNAQEEMMQRIQAMYDALDPSVREMVFKDRPVQAQRNGGTPRIRKQQES